MIIYHGTVKDNQVILSENARIPDGTPVEVRVAPAASTLPADKQLLQARGLLPLETAKPLEMLDPLVGRHVIVVQGKPISQMIIDERR